MKRKWSLSPKANKLYNIALQFKRSAIRYKKLACKANVGKAVVDMSTDSYIKTNVNIASYNFIISQIKNQKKLPRGRRYSDEHKIFALTLMKQSPKAYRLLRKTFALPSRKIIMGVLNRMALSTGVTRT